MDRHFRPSHHRMSRLFNDKTFRYVVAFYEDGQRAVRKYHFVRRRYQWVVETFLAVSFKAICPLISWLFHGVYDLMAYPRVNIHDPLFFQLQAPQTTGYMFKIL